MLSPKPGQRNLPSSSRRNQLTLKIRGGFLSAAAEVEPVAEVVAHVVAAERQHGERVAADLAELAERGGGHFRAHRGGRVDAERPVERLRHERHGRAAAAAEDERRDRHALRVVVRRVGRRALRHRRGEAAVGVGRLAYRCRASSRCLASRWRASAARRPCLPTTRRRRR